MNRKQKILEIVRPIAVDDKSALIYAAHLEELLDAILPEQIGEAYQNALEQGDMESAVSLCADYYRKKTGNDNITILNGKNEYDKAWADRTVKGMVRVVNIDWTFPDGEMDFLFNPTLTDGPVNNEWLWQLNRHDYWANMARVYRATKEEKYAVAFEKQLLRWIAQTKLVENWNGPGSAWRTIECGIRLLGAWPVTFDGFRSSTSVSDVTLLLMIASMHRQSLHLVAHPTRANWLMMEANGVYTFSGLFPELRDAQANRQIAAKRLLEEMEGQILPDGMHNELSPDYQSVVNNCASNFYSLAKDLGLENEISEEFAQLIQKTVKAAVLLSTPAFTQPRTNDCYTIATTKFTERAEQLFGPEPEYRFVNTNRQEGLPPAGETASVFLPYAGFAVMRSDWTENGTYLCFDVGPMGKAHVHQDKLNINLYQGAEELLYDDGGGQYEHSEARTYAVSGYGHNIVLVDGMAQNRKEPLAVTEPIDAKWVSNQEYDYAVGTYEDTYGDNLTKPAVHKREVRFCKPGFFCVQDQLTSVDGAEHSYEVLFHMDTTKVKQVAEYPGAVISDYGRKYDLLILPMDAEEHRAELKLVSAQTDPYQGWYNGRNEAYLHEAVTFSREVSGVRNYRFNTLLFPIAAGQELPKVTRRADGRITVVFDGKEYLIDLENLYN